MNWAGRRLRFLSGGLIASLGLLLAAVVLYDVYVDIAFQGDRPYTTLLENALPLLFDTGVVAAGVWAARSRDPALGKQVVLWTGVSVVSLLGLSGWVYGIQFAQGEVKPAVIVAQVASMGAVAGIVVGVYSSRLKRRQRQISSLFENSNDCIAEVRFADGVPEVRNVNPRFEATFGVTSEDVRGRALDDVVVDGDELNRRAWRGERFETEVERTTAGGETRVFRLQTVPVDSRGGTTHGYAVYTDVTESRRYTERVDALHRATQDLISAEKPADAAAYGADVAAEVLSASGAAVFSVAGGGFETVASTDDGPVFEPDESVVRECVDAGEPMSTADVRRSLSADVESVPATIAVPLAEGHVLLVVDWGREAFDGDDVALARVLGNNIGAALERITREQELRERERELTEQNDRLDRFTSIVSHDLRNPLSVAQGYTELAREERDETEHLERVSGALDRMESLIEELLTLARQGETVAEPETIDLAAVASDAWEDVSADDATPDIEGTVELESDETRTRQLFENLFRNAVEHGSTGSRTQSDDAVEHGDPGVTVTVGPLDESGFYVADDGPGIPESEREKVFDHGYTTAEDGTGFGLPIVEEVVDAHGGTVTVTEGTEGGARFEIRQFGANDTSA